MPIQFAAKSLTIRADKTTVINQPFDQSAARKKLVDIAANLVDGKGVKSGYLRLHMADGVATLSRGGGHLRSGYSAASSLIKQLVDTAYGADSEAARSLGTYMNGRTKVGTKSLLKLIAAMEGDAAPKLSIGRQLKGGSLQAPAPNDTRASQASRALLVAEAAEARFDPDELLFEALAQVPWAKKYWGEPGSWSNPDDQVQQFVTAMDEIEQTRALQEEKLQLYHQAIEAGATDPLSRLDPDTAKWIANYNATDHSELQNTRKQISAADDKGASIAQIAKDLNLHPTFVRREVVEHRLESAWNRLEPYDQRAFIIQSLVRGGRDPDAPLYSQMSQVRELGNQDTLDWYVNLRTEGMTEDVVKLTQPLLLQRLAQRYAWPNPSDEALPASTEAQAMLMGKDLCEEMAELILEKNPEVDDSPGQALMSARSQWKERHLAQDAVLQQLKNGTDVPDMVAEQDTHFEGSALSLKNKLRHTEEVRQASIDYMLLGIGRNLLSRGSESAPDNAKRNALLKSLNSALTAAGQALERSDTAHQTPASQSQHQLNSARIVELRSHLESLVTPTMMGLLDLAASLDKLPDLYELVEIEDSEDLALLDATAEQMLQLESKLAAFDNPPDPLSRSENAELLQLRARVNRQVDAALTHQLARLRSMVESLPTAYAIASLTTSVAQRDQAMALLPTFQAIETSLAALQERSDQMSDRAREQMASFSAKIQPVATLISSRLGPEPVILEMPDEEDADDDPPRQVR